MSICMTRKHGLELYVVMFQGRELTSFWSREAAERYAMNNCFGGNRE